MKFHVTVIGAGSLGGVSFCKRASSLNWKVTAYSIWDNDYYYPGWWARMWKHTSSDRWTDNVDWYSSFNADECFPDLHEEIHNCTGLVYMAEPTPAIRDRKFTFEKNAIRMAHMVGDWSVRHLVLVTDETIGCGISEEAQHEIGKCHPNMMVSLIRPGHVYSRGKSSTMKPLYKRAIQSKFIKNLGPLDVTEDNDLGHCITTLIHNESDPLCYRVLDSGGILSYLHNHKNPDDPEDSDTDLDDLDVNDNGDADNEIDEEKTEHLRRVDNEDSEHETWVSSWHDSSPNPSGPGVYDDVPKHRYPLGEEVPSKKEHKRLQREAKSGSKSIGSKGESEDDSGMKLRNLKRMDMYAGYRNGLIHSASEFDPFRLDSCPEILSLETDWENNRQWRDQSMLLPNQQDEWAVNSNNEGLIDSSLGIPQYIVQTYYKGHMIEHKI